MNINDVAQKRDHKCHPFTNLRGMIHEKTISEYQLPSSPFPAVKSIAPLATCFKDEPNQRKQRILTNYKACQPCCFGNTKRFYRRFQLQKFCSDS